MKIIGGIYRNRNLVTPKGLEVRPSASRLREALFNICQTYIEGAQFLDLFAGSGAIGFEALSRGAKSVTFIDNSRESIRTIQQNAKSLDVENQVKILLGDTFELLERLSQQDQSFDIIFADPPYHSKGQDNISYGEKILTELDHRSLLSDQGVLFLEESSSALPENFSFKNISLKSKRRMGRSLLLEYILNNEGDHAIECFSSM